ncbi:hypothetical protein L1987_54871 [Smallanthus sonchifolius]|uniref:Uncharacterized protein n=1 Tax=Smallanthus sonchifolius TaxID=185202 RepID=A0ACB9E7U4_9ASTR|nr:hypothetical protein L1987_54871 [Smallanthus sonchifolius]
MLIYGCPQLQDLSNMELPHIKLIEGETEWLKGLGYDKSPWENIFVPLKKRRDMVGQLFDATNTLKHFHDTLSREAVADANKAIELDPSNPKAYFRKGTACFNLEEYQTAKIAFEAGSTLNPEDARFTDWIKKCDKCIADPTPVFSVPGLIFLTKRFTINHLCLSFWILPVAVVHKTLKVASCSSNDTLLSVNSPSWHILSVDSPTFTFLVTLLSVAKSVADSPT